ncbi:putative BRISC complex subunit [Dirofilaria immitis]
MMERSIRNIKQILRENVTRFLENADGREVIVNVTARLVKKQNGAAKENGKVEQPKRHYVKNMNNTSSQNYRSSDISNQNNSFAVDFYDKREERYHYSKD